MDSRTTLALALDRYAHLQPQHAALAAEFADFARRDALAASRERLAGHFTGSAFVVSADGARTLLLHHAKLERWLQPGGHADGEFDLAAVALREAIEETGLTGLIVEREVFDIDRHAIPARGNEPEHWHWDVRFVVRAAGGETPRISHESRAARWDEISSLAAGAVDASIARMAKRWLARS
jgi:8-oxo-dGTP pyrophosphatase MutT (NUDIX family)